MREHEHMFLTRLFINTHIIAKRRVHCNLFFALILAMAEIWYNFWRFEGGNAP